jgi:hypothetical protein
VGLAHVHWLLRLVSSLGKGRRGRWSGCGLLGAVGVSSGNPPLVWVGPASGMVPVDVGKIQDDIGETGISTTSVRVGYMDSRGSKE